VAYIACNIGAAVAEAAVGQETVLESYIDAGGTKHFIQLFVDARGDWVGEILGGVPIRPTFSAGPFGSRGQALIAVENWIDAHLRDAGRDAASA
jgi:hypothetical protein